MITSGCRIRVKQGLSSSVLAERIPFASAGAFCCPMLLGEWSSESTMFS